jgi:hypothetical protein
MQADESDDIKQDADMSDSQGLEDYGDEGDLGDLGDAAKNMFGNEEDYNSEEDNLSPE